MPRLKKVPCAHCDSKLVPGTSFCTNCEQPTVWASHDERTTWELRQWQEKGTPRLKRAHSPAVASVTPIKSRPARAPLTPHPAAVKAAVAKAPPAPSKDKPLKRTMNGEKAPTTPKISAPKVSAPKVATPRVSASKASAPKVPTPKKRVAVSKSDPEPAPEKPRKPIHDPVKREPAVPQPAATVDITDAPSMKRDPAIEQVELLRELLQRVISIEEKMGGNGVGRARRLRLLKR